MEAMCDNKTLTTTKKLPKFPLLFTFRAVHKMKAVSKLKKDFFLDRL